jgi:hypothetical protein
MKRRDDQYPAPPDFGPVPGGIRDRAMRAVIMRGPVPEDAERTRASQAFWRAFREWQALLAHAEQQDVRLGRPPARELIIKQTMLQGHLAIVTTKVADQHRLRSFATFVLDDTTAEVTDLTCFASVAAALLHHDAMVRAALREEVGGVTIPLAVALAWGRQ